MLCVLVHEVVTCCVSVWTVPRSIFGDIGDCGRGVCFGKAGAKRYHGRTWSSLGKLELADKGTPPSRQVHLEKPTPACGPTGALHTTGSCCVVVSVHEACALRPEQRTRLEIFERRERWVGGPEDDGTGHDPRWEQPGKINARVTAAPLPHHIDHPALGHHRQVLGGGAGRAAGRRKSWKHIWESAPAGTR